MPYFYNTPEDQHAMLNRIGAASVDELMELVPSGLRLHRPLDLPKAMTEIELDAHLQALAASNQPASEFVCFLGAGAYDHHVPAVVDAVAARSEFYTSYTPYQAEVSQGNLQVMFEYQSLITRLTGMDVANASVYDGATAVTEAVLMAIHCTQRPGRVLVPTSLHPEYRQTIAAYLINFGTELVTLPASDGTLDPGDLDAALDDRTACVVLQHPNFFGCLEDMEPMVRAVHDAGALVISVFDPISLGLLKRPGDLGADIAVAEGQALGSPLSFGGPYLGIMACREPFLRRMPGRIAGQTIDREGKRCFVLTLQTREQHIRRAKATSNVCTNQGLLALRATVFLALLGPQGLREMAELCLQKSHYLARLLCENDRFSLAFGAPTFKECVIRDAENRVDDLLARARSAGFLAGIPLSRWYPEHEDCFLIAVTEKRTRHEMDALAELFRQSCR
ncbi:MAG: aminomethyl-transferring glycine dehydrogenase subunit GcvPA [Pirellulales bacterium]|nr:aminomethyl-transferring glycine dehydrogenase subunit GcvPA [Pirellulales bacterium]